MQVVELTNAILFIAEGPCYPDGRTTAARLFKYQHPETLEHCLYLFAGDNDCENYWRIADHDLEWLKRFARL